jgi:hypothetical protein
MDLAINNPVWGFFNPPWKKQPVGDAE